MNNLRTGPLTKKPHLIYLEANLYCDTDGFIKIIADLEPNFFVLDLVRIFNAYVFFLLQYSVQATNWFIIRRLILKTTLSVTKKIVHINGVAFDNFNILISAWRISYLKQPVFFNTVLKKVLKFVFKKYKTKKYICLIGPALYTNSMPKSIKYSIWQVLVSKLWLKSNIKCLYSQEQIQKLTKSEINRLYSESRLLKQQPRRLSQIVYFSRFNCGDDTSYDEANVVDFWKKRCSEFNKVKS